MSGFCLPMVRPENGWRLNKTLHGRSVHRPEDVPHHNVVKGYNDPGTGDAVDFFSDAGTLVQCCHDGKVVAARSIPGAGFVVYVSGGAHGHLVTTVYCHLSGKGRVAFGKVLHMGDKIGYVSRELSDPHLHFEVWVDGIAFSGTRPDVLSGRVLYLAQGWKG